MDGRNRSSAQRVREEAWMSMQTGIMGFTKIEDPFVGPVLTPNEAGEIVPQVGQYISAGYSGHGMPRGYACAEVSAGMILAEFTNTTYDLPEWFPTQYLTENRI